MKLTALLATLMLTASALNAASVYDAPVKDIKGKDTSLKAFEGKVILVVNVASKCGLTPQYEGLEATYKKYQAKGLVVAGFPCNQFGKQEPGSNEEILSFCSTKYNVTFPMFDKLETSIYGTFINSVSLIFLPIFSLLSSISTLTPAFLNWR